VFENRVPRKIFGPERDDVTGKLGNLHNEELNGLYSSPNIIWVTKSIRMRGTEHVARVGERKVAYRILVEKPEENRSLGRPRRR
jgi:hypothetical protein